MADTALAPADIIATELSVANGTITTTSLKVAEHFGKRHDDVLKRIRNLDCSPEFYARNFAEVIVEYQNGKGGTQKAPAYNITRDGFTFLAMGFTGKEAAKWKEAYIAAFNRMADELTARHQADLQRQLAEAQKLIPHTISPGQKRTIQKMVADIAYTANNADTRKEFKRIYSALNDRFGISSYGELPASEYNNAVAFLRSLGAGELIEVQVAQPGVFLAKEQARALQHHLDLCWNLASRARRDMGARVELRAAAEHLMFHSYEAPTHRALIALR